MKKLLLILLCLPMIGFGQEKNKYAKDIEVSIDKFDGSSTWQSPTFGKGIMKLAIQPVKFIKIKKDGDVVIYLSLATKGAALNVGEKGAIILFTDGEKMEFPNAEIDADAGEGAYWEYSAFVRISDEQLDKFITKDLDDLRLYIYESFHNVTKKKRKQIKGWAQAIKEAE